MASRLFVQILVLVAGVGGVYVPDASTDKTDLSGVVFCPKTCICSYTQMTAQCHFSYAEYNLKDLSPWHLTRLRIHGDSSAWNFVNSQLSIKEVLYRDIPKEDINDLKEKLTELTHLELSYVPVSRILDSDLDQFEHLEFLSLTNNNISSVAANAFANLPLLETLKLDNNQIAKLPDDVFQKSENLKMLHLRGNILNVINSKVFEGLSSLELLDLRNNHIEYLETLVESLGTLDTLDVRGNEISYVSENVVVKLLRLRKVFLAKNPFWCSCSLKDFIEAFRLNSSSLEESLECSAPEELVHVKFEDLDLDTLPCDTANVTSLVLSSSVLYQLSLVLDCQVTGDQPLAVYWLTPWGERFTNTRSKLTFPDFFEDTKSDETFSAMNLLVTSRVYVSRNGSLHIEKYRGHFSGDFTCVGMNLIGQSNQTVSVGIEHKLPFIYITSLFVGAYSGGSMFVLAIIIGMVRLFVNKCLHSDSCNCCCCRCDDVEIFEEKIKAEDLDVEIEVKTAESDCTPDFSEYDPSLPPPDPPVNSPQLRLSPDKCTTPDNEENSDQTKVSTFC